MYTMTLEDYDNGVILVEYSVEGKKYTIMKRSAKRSIFLQVVLFSKGYLHNVDRQVNEADVCCNWQHLQKHRHSIGRDRRHRVFC